MQLMYHVSKVAVLVAVSISAAAAQFSPPPSMFADTESSTNAQLAAWSDLTRRFDVALVLDATPSNNVAAAFGADFDGDGVLSRSETALSFGWDCGEWFVEAGDGRVASAADGEGGRRRREMSVSLRIGADGAVRGAEISGDGAALPSLAAMSGLALCAPSEWDLVKVTARGIDAPGGLVSLRRANDPAIILMR